MLCRLLSACMGRHPTLGCLLVMWRLQGRWLWLCRHRCQTLCVLKHAFALSPVMSPVWLSGRCHFKTHFRYVEIPKLRDREARRRVSSNSLRSHLVALNVCVAALRLHLTFSSLFSSSLYSLSQGDLQLNDGDWGR